MDSARLWIRDNCNVDRIKDLNDAHSVRELVQSKLGFYLGLTFLAFVFLIQRVITNLKSKSSSRTTSRSPDPEKPVGTRVKAPERPLGGTRAL